MAQTAFEIVVDPLAGKGIFAEEVAGDIFGYGAAHIFAGDALAGMDAGDTARRFEHRALFVDLVEAIVVGAQVFDLVGEVDVFDFGDFGKKVEFRNLKP